MSKNFDFFYTNNVSFRCTLYYYWREKQIAPRSRYFHCLNSHRPSTRALDQLARKKSLSYCSVKRYLNLPLSQQNTDKNAWRGRDQLCLNIFELLWFWTRDFRFGLFYILVCTYGPFIMMIDHEVILFLAQKRRPSREARFISLSEFASRLTHTRIAGFS